MALINKAKLEMSLDGTTEWKHLPACTTFPDLGIDPEAVDTTTTDDGLMTAELGIGDPGTLTYTFRYRKGNTEAYRLAKAAQDLGAKPHFRVTFQVGPGADDLLKIEYPSGGLSTKILGGGVNDVLNFEMATTVAGDLEITEPEGI